jgi:hypothetical protein
LDAFHTVLVSFSLSSKSPLVAQLVSGAFRLCSLHCGHHSGQWPLFVPRIDQLLSGHACFLGRDGRSKSKPSQGTLDTGRERRHRRSRPARIAPLLSVARCRRAPTKGQGNATRARHPAGPGRPVRSWPATTWLLIHPQWTAAAVAFHRLVSGLVRGRV